MILKPGVVVEIEGQCYKILNLNGPDMYTSRFNCMVERIPSEQHAF